MRARARDAERNSDIANGILLAYRRNIVGRGFNLQSRTKNEAFMSWRRSFGGAGLNRKIVTLQASSLCGKC